MADYVLPSLGADMEAATLVEWHVAPNDVVKRGQVVGLVETEKALMDIEFFQDGIIDEILVPVGSKVAVGTPLLRFRPLAATAIGQASAAPGPAVPETRIEPPAPTAPATSEAGYAAPSTPGPSVATPMAVAPPAKSLGHRLHAPVRHLAAELGVDLDTVAGTGPGGEVLKRDVRAAAAAPAQSAEHERDLAETGRRPISPRARRLAERYGLDATVAAATGPQGSVSAEDIEADAHARDEAERGGATAVPAPPPFAAALAEGASPAATQALPAEAAPIAGEAPTGALPPAPAASQSDTQRAVERQLAMRRAIALLMARSKREIPHYYLTLDIDLHRTMAWLEQENLARPMATRLLPAALLIKATALSLGEVPELNGFWVDDHFVPGQGIHVGVAISLRGGGLVAPAIHDADQLTLTDLMASLRDLVARTRTGSLHRAEMADPTITITNLGDLGVDSVLGVIYPPQVALVGFGRVRDRAVAIDGLVGARPMITATLAADHRNSDGHRGGILLAAIDRRLQEPEQL